MKIYLYGAPGSGKTTLGRQLAAALGFGFFDLDAMVSERSGMTVADIFARDGEEAFRKLESESLSFCAEMRRDAVIALGGGTLLDGTNRELCEKTGDVLRIETPPQEELSRRLAASPGTRPLGDKALERASHYASFGNTVSAVFSVQGTLILVGTGISKPVEKWKNTLMDANFARIWKGKPSLGVIASGEKHKRLPAVSGLWEAFSVAGLGRNDMVAVFGGGVALDLAGFAAATWMRGIGWMNAPTTLLSMVDASIGGKTGFDLECGKNLVGAFHPPRLVVIDTRFLSTLPAELVSEGRAEMIKHEILGAPRCSGDLRALPRADEIAANIAVKVKTVEEDPLERTGRRLLLNCGHTVAHAIEKMSGWTLSHGRAVAAGCVEEARLAVRLSLAPPDWPVELEERFRAAGLDTSLPGGLSFETMKEVMRGDKKRTGDTVTFALPCGWGDVRRVDIDLSEGGKA